MKYNSLNYHKSPLFQDPIQGGKIVSCTSEKHLVAVIGAGPAGLSAAKQLTCEKIHVALFNRDVKPGGLAEYGIYPSKHKLKEALRAQFRQILALPQIDYYGNISIGQSGDLTFDDLRDIGFQALMVTTGAQKAKHLGIPGEELNGVYHAQELVYHYNLLPPFSTMPYTIGRQVAIVGAGNVMTDIARWLLHEKRVEKVYIIVRRSPADVKFDRKELEYVAANLDLSALNQEFERTAPIMLAMSKDIEQAKSNILAAIPNAFPKKFDARLIFTFLSSPTKILGNSSGQVVGLEIEDNTLEMKNGETKAKGLGIKHQIPIDNVILAIGNLVDDQFGLPSRGNGYVIHPEPRFPIDNTSYEASDSQNGQLIKDIFIAGWARRASTGLVGIARKDGVNGAKAMIQYLQNIPPISMQSLEKIQDRLAQLNKPIITKSDILYLEELERKEAQRLNLDEYKWATNTEMLRLIKQG
jgi:ferredoxin--NADP+ reductase